MEMIDYFAKNIEWLFSGIGVFLLGLFITFLNAKKIQRNNSVLKKEKNEELQKLKKEFFGNNNKVRIYLFKKLAQLRHENNQLQIRDITDAAEEEMGFSHDFTASELVKLEEEGIIWFVKDIEDLISPYTSIKLTEKYFLEIE